MNALDIFRELRKGALPHMEAYQTDLDIDLQTLVQFETKYGRVPVFAYIVRKYGTNMDVCYPIEALPAVGEEVPYLFGKADRRRVIASIGETLYYFIRRERGQVQKTLFYNGEALIELSIEEAATELSRYKADLK